MNSDNSKSSNDNSNSSGLISLDPSILPETRKKQQKIGFSIAIFIFIAIVLILSFSDMGGKISGKESNQQAEEDWIITIQNPSQNTDSEDRWLVQAQEQITIHNEQIERAEQENRELKEKIKELEQERIASQERFYDLEESIHKLSLEVESSKKSQKQKQKGRRQSQGHQEESYGQLNNTNNADIANNRESNTTNEVIKTIETITFDYSKTTKNNNYNNQDKQVTFDTAQGYIAQGSYVPAKIISSVDSQVGISSQANPKPVLLRITGKAKSAVFYDNNNFHTEENELAVDLKGCIVTAGAIGELSSEKIYIKLSKMTCANNLTKVTEVQVRGYVSAKGSNGIRGRVIMREGALLGKSFLAGAVGGLGKAYSQSLAPPLLLSGGTTTQKAISFKDASKRGFGEGLGSASNQLSNYLIKRAEQYQPVISIPSGIDVEIVFLEGFYLDGRSKDQGKNNASSSK